MNEPVDENESVERIKSEIRERMGVCPSFFLLAADSPRIMENLWWQAQVSYLDNPLPPLFKEKLFTYLSRFCNIGYCLARHCSFLVGRGHVAGDASCKPLAPDEALRLLQQPIPNAKCLNAHLDHLATIGPLDEWPSAGSELEISLLFCSAEVFLTRGEHERCQTELRRLLGNSKYAALVHLLAFIRAAHFWTETHPDLAFEGDLLELLAEHGALADWISSYPVFVSEELHQRASEDLANLRIAHSTQLESQRQLQAILDSAVDAIITIDEQGLIESVNQSACRLFGFAADEAIGNNVKMLMPDPYQSEHDQYIANYKNTDEKKIIGIGREVIGQRKDGTKFPMHLSVSEVNLPNRRFFTGIVHDMTDRVRLDQELRGQMRVLERLAKRDSLNDVLTLLVEYAEKSRPEMAGSILLLDEKTGSLRHGATFGLPDFYREAIDGIQVGPEVGSCGTAAFIGERVVVEDIRTHPYWVNYRELAERASLRACWSEPIISSSGNILGTFAMYYRQPKSPDASDLEFIAGRAHLAALAIERVQADNSLRRLAQIVESTDDAVIGKSLDGNIETWNKGAERLYGYTAEEAIGQSISMLVPDDLANELPQIFNQLQRDETVDHFETVRVAKDGRRIDISLSISPMRGHDGSTIGSSTIARDISQRKRAELALRASEHHYRSVVETAGSAVVCISTDHKIVDWNPAAERILGYSRQEAIGKSPFELLLEKDLHAEAKAIAEGVNRGQSVKGIEFHVRHRNGEQRVLLWNSNHLLDGNDKPIGRIAVGQDITELKAAQDKLVQSERLAAMGQMMSSIAHESRNALQRIQAGVDMLKLDIPDGSEAAGDLAQIAKARNDLQTLLDGTRDFAAPVVLDLQKCNLADVWQQAWRNLAQLREGRQAELLEETEGIELECTIDPFRIEQIFRNLIENSIAACVDPVKINVACTDCELESVPAMRIAVRDNGPGLTVEQENRIFDAFYTTRPKGTGLGMAIAMKTVKAHHGTLVARNGEDGGAEFVMTLPREQTST